MKSPAIASQVVALSATQVGQIESGRTIPTVQALHALAVAYKVSPQRFLDLVASERQQAGLNLPESVDEAEAAYNAALKESRWNDAIALALHGERLADSPTEEVVWRARRGTCLPYVGRHDEAILVLTECLNSPHLGRHRRFQILRNLADVHVVAGYLESAVDAARKALALVPEGTSDATRVAVACGLVSALLAKQEMADTPDAAELDEVLALIDQARAFHVSSDPHWTLFLDLSRAIALELQGKKTPAARALTSIARRAATAREDRLRMVALLNLGILRHRQGRLKSAEDNLLKALSCALSLQQVNETFDIYVQLLQLARQTGSPYQRDYFQRCQHYYPLVSARTPSVVRFEQMERGSVA